MKSFYTDTSLRDEYTRSNTFAVDCVEIHLKDEAGANAPLYLCSGGINIEFDSPTAPDTGVNTYTAQGQFMGFSPLNENFDVTVGKFSVYLSAIGNNLAQNFIDYEIEGKRVVLYKAFLSFGPSGTDPLSIVSTPILMFDGVIYNFSVNEGASTCQINLECSSLFADFERTNGRKTNNWSNWLFQGNTKDKAFEKAGFVGNTEFKWGRD